MVRYASWRYWQECRVRKFRVQIYRDVMIENLYKFEVFEENVYYGDIYVLLLNRELTVISILASLPRSNVYSIICEIEKVLRSRRT